MQTIDYKQQAAVGTTAGHVASATLGACLGGAIGTSVAVWCMWPRIITHQEVSLINQPHEGYSDLMLTIITIMLASVGVMIAIGALILGIFSWKGVKLAMSQITRSMEKEAINNISNEVIETILLNELVKKSTIEVYKNIDIQKTSKQAAEKAMKDFVKRFISGDFDDLIEQVVARVTYGATIEEEDEDFGSQDMNHKSARDEDDSDSESVEGESGKSKPTNTGD